MYWQVPFYVLPHIIAMLMQAVIPLTSILPNMVVKPRYKEGVLSAKKNFNKLRISLIRGFKVSVKIICPILGTLLMYSILSVKTYTQIVRRSGHNRAVTSASA